MAPNTLILVIRLPPIPGLQQTILLTKLPVTTCLIASTTLRYNFDKGFFIQGRAGRDAYTDRYTSVVPTGTAYRANGQITEQSVKFWDLNVDGLAGKTFALNNNLSLTPNIGGSTEEPGQRLLPTVVLTLLCRLYTIF